MELLSTDVFGGLFLVTSMSTALVWSTTLVLSFEEAHRNLTRILTLYMYEVPKH